MLSTTELFTDPIPEPRVPGRLICHILSGGQLELVLTVTRVPLFNIDDDFSWRCLVVGSV